MTRNVTFMLYSNDMFRCLLKAEFAMLSLKVSEHNTFSFKHVTEHVISIYNIKVTFLS